MQSVRNGAAYFKTARLCRTDAWFLQDESQSAGAESSDDGVGSDERSNHIQPSKSKKTVTNLGMESSSIRSDGVVGANGFGGPSPAKRPRSKLHLSSAAVFHVVDIWLAFGTRMAMLNYDYQTVV
jgi:hypothetical protein